jgi:hypothetical protein
MPALPPKADIRIGSEFRLRHDVHRDPPRQSRLLTRAMRPVIPLGKSASN